MSATVDGISAAAESIVYGNFYSVLGPFLTHVSAIYRPTRAVWCLLLGAHARRMLIGACNPTVVPIHIS